MMLITGGARVGKTKLAINLCKKCGAHVLYIAATEPSDDFFDKEIIRRSRKQRPYNWVVRESYINIADMIEAEGTRYDAIVIENLATLVAGLMRYYHYSEEENNLRVVEREIVEEMNRIVLAVKKVEPLVIFVTQEVQPQPQCIDIFYKALMEILGRVNQYIASISTDVYCVVSGIPLKIK
jgi:adenosylcobinamide kinase/adenosylcobinamide-phosphate guanylyltransferase